MNSGTSPHESMPAGQTGPIVIVSGLPRSGTSLMMRMLEAGGLPPLTDSLRIADVDNPTGYYEFEPVKKLVQGEHDWLPRARGKAVKVISALLNYLPPGYDYRLLFMRRNLDEILVSQRKMLARRGEVNEQATDEEMARLFEAHLAQVRGWIAARPHMALLDVSYNALLVNPERELQQVGQFLGKLVNTGDMAAVIDPALYRNRV